MTPELPPPPPGFAPSAPLEPPPPGFVEMEGALPDRETGSQTILRHQEAMKGARERLLADDARKKQAVAGEIQDRLGVARYDDQEKFGGGVSGWIRQIDIARSGDLADKQKKFRESFPAGDLVSVPTSDGPVILARATRDEPFRRLKFGPSAVGALMSEPVVGGTVGSLAGPIGTAVGTGVGVLAQGAIESARGFGTAEGGYGPAVTEGTVAGAVDVGMRGASRLMFGPKLEAGTRAALVDAIKASEELGLEPLAAGQVGGPFMRGTFRQVGVTSPKIEKKVTAQEKSLLDAFRRVSDDVPAGVSDDALKSVVRAQQRELDALMRPGAMTRTDSSVALQNGIETYEKASGRLGGRLYNKAHAVADDVAYNANPAQRLAQEIKKGVLGRGREVTQTKATGILDEGGLPLSRQVTSREPVSLSSTPQGQLATAVDDLLALDPIITKNVTAGGEWTAFEQVKTLRTRLFDLKQSDDGQVRREAGRLWSALTDVMDNPISGNPEFTRAHQIARGFWRMREENLEKTFVARALATDTPEVLARTYMSPGHATELATIRDLIPRPAFEQFRAGFMTDIANAPTAQQGLNRLRNFRATDKNGLRVLVSQPEEDALTNFLVKKAQFEGSPARNILERQLTEGEQMVAMAKQGSAGDVADAVRLSGGKDSDFAKWARAGVYKSILDDATKVTAQGVEVLDAGKVISGIQAWKKSGKLDSLFAASDWRRIEQFQKYSAPVAEGADIGGGMMAGGLRQQVISAPVQTLYGDVKKIVLGPVHKLYSNHVAATLLSRDASYYQLAQAGPSAGLSILPLREGAVAYTLMQRELEHEGVKQ